MATIVTAIGGLNYYIKGDYLKLMLNYIHTWSHFRRANPGTGDDAFDEVLLRAQVLFLRRQPECPRQIRC